MNYSNNINENFFLNGIQHNVKSKGKGKSHLKVEVSYPFSIIDSYDIVKLKGGIAMLNISNVKRTGALALLFIGLFAIINVANGSLFSALGGSLIALSSLSTSYILWKESDMPPADESRC